MDKQAEPEYTSISREREAEAVRQARRRLRHIEEQIEKRQYWNALVALNEAERFLQQAFDVVLKERTD